MKEEKLKEFVQKGIGNRCIQLPLKAVDLPFQHSPFQLSNFIYFWRRLIWNNLSLFQNMSPKVINQRPLLSS